MVKVRYAEEDELLETQKVARQYLSKVGFVRLASLKEHQEKKTLKVIEVDGKIVGFVNFYLRKDGWTVIYELAVLKEFTNKGYARKLIESLPKPIRLKCPVDNESNEFYRHIGFTLLETVKGRKRDLNVWLLF